MTARRTFHCRACKTGRCEDCVRFVWDGEGCVHACYSDRQLHMFGVDDVQTSGHPAPAAEAEDFGDVDW